MVEQNYEQSDGWLIGVYAELKNPGFTNSLFNVSMEQMVLDELKAHGYAIEDVSQDLQLVQPVILQSKETDSLQILSTLTDIPLQQLMNAGYVWSDDLLANFSTYAQGVGPDKSFFYGPGVNLDEARKRVQTAHETGRKGHTCTLLTAMLLIWNIFICKYLKRFVPV